MQRLLTVKKCSSQQFINLITNVMKKIITNLLFLFCGIVATTASGQSTFSRLSPGSSGQTTFSGLSKDYTQSMDSLLLFVNKAPVTTGILYDRIQPFAYLSRLKENGQATKTTFKNFVQGWSELHRASFNPTFGNVEVLKNSIKTNTDPSFVDIGVINTKINYIDFGTPTQPSLTMQGGYLRNVPNVNPFLEKQVTMVAALKEIATGNQISFTLKPEFLLQYIGAKIQTLQADFGTGTLFTLISNQVINANPAIVTYTSSGLKTIVFTIVFENNSTETMQSTLNVNVPVNTSMMRGGFPLEEDFVGTESITASIPFQGYNEATATAGTLEYRTYYSKVVNDGSAKSKITKPIIILDGYDPEDSRKIYDGSLNYDSTKNSIYGLMEFDPDNNPLTDNSENLVKKLRETPYGFDITLVNFPKGADYIERNAMALVSLLARENLKLSQNGSTEQVSIIGPSMGGLVSRYALAYMEKNNIPHNTKLWVSFDSPHLGANIPISAQENIYFFGYNAKQDEAYEKFKTNFFSPAARQMLIEQLDGTQLDGDTFTQNPNLFFPQLYGPNNTTRFRQLFTTALNNNGLPNSNGYPQNMRKIAIVNGTTNGTKNFSEGQKYLDLAAFIRIKWGQIFGTEFVTSIKMTAFENNFLSTPNTWGHSFSGTAFIKKDVAVVGANVSRKNINPRGSMDVVPGGTFAIGDNIKDSFDKAFESLPIVNDIQWRTNFKYNTFIPTISSLGFKNSDFDWSTPVNSNLVCTANTQINFDSYYAPTTNEDHVKITAESATWLLEELKGNPQAPHFPVQENALTGEAIVCVNQTTTYTFADICKVPSPVIYQNQNGATVNGWSVSSNL